MPKSIREIQDNAFSNWTTLKRVCIDKKAKLKKIGAYAFSGTGITVFLAPYCLVEIGPGAFQGCQNLITVKVSGGL